MNEFSKKELETQCDEFSKKELETQCDEFSKATHIKEEVVSRRKVGAVIFGALLGVAAIAKEKSAQAIVSSDTPILTKIDTTLVAMAAHVATVANAVKEELKNFNEFFKPFMETVDNIKKVSDSWNVLIDQINKVLDASEKSRDFIKSITDKDANIFYVQAKQLADYVTRFTTENSDWAKVRLRRFDWYAQALVRAIEDISSHYQDMYNAWERASKVQGGNNKISPEGRIFIAAAHQQLKATYYEVKGIAFQNQFEEIQKKVGEDKKRGKLPADKSESDVIADLTKQMNVQLQIAQYSVQVEILNSINILLLSTNRTAFAIPKNMKMPRPEDFKRAFDAACKGEKYPGVANDKA